jgi:uncharacterized protein (TIGR02453 family)
MAVEFTGFPREGLDFLAELPSHDKDWFAANRAPYDACVAAPAKVFVDALGERLQDEISPAIVVQPKVNGAIAPINRDVRFSADKTAYKDHLLLKWWEGENKKLAPTLYVRLSSVSVGFGSGTMFDSIDRWREAVDDEKTGAALVAALHELAAGRELEVAGAELKRVPAPYDADHPRADLLRHKMFQARWSEPLPDSVSNAEFVDWCAERLVAAADVHRWLVDKL